MGRSETVITLKIWVLQLGIWTNQKGNSKIVPYRELIKKAAIISLHEIKRAPQYFIYKLGYIKKATSNQKGTSIFLEKSKGHIQFPDWIQLKKIEKRCILAYWFQKCKKKKLAKLPIVPFWQTANDLLLELGNIL